MSPEEAAKSLGHPDKFYLLCSPNGVGVKAVKDHSGTKGWTGPIKIYKKDKGEVVPVGIKSVFHARLDRKENRQSEC